MKMQELWKQKDLADKFGISEDTLVSWRELGLPFIKLGRETYILQSSFMRWVKSRETSQNGKPQTSL